MLNPVGLLCGSPSNGQKCRWLVHVCLQASFWAVYSFHWLIHMPANVACLCLYFLLTNLSRSYVSYALEYYFHKSVAVDSFLELIIYKSFTFISAFIEHIWEICSNFNVLLKIWKNCGVILALDFTVTLRNIVYNRMWYNHGLLSSGDTLNWYYCYDKVS